MAVTQYIGARYVPLLMGEWDSSIEYEPLSIVTYQGASYTSKQAVPVGVSITNEQFWALSGNYNAQVEAYRREVQGFNDRIETVEDGIDNLLNDSWIAPKNLSDEVKDMHSAAKNYFQKVYINNVDGNDSTGEINNPEKPFLTMEAAFNVLNYETNNYDFRFQTPGTYFLPRKIFSGAVIHFRAYSQTAGDIPAGDITIMPSPGTPEGGFYFYDTHLNFMGNANNRFVFNAGMDRLIECEGSTLWASHTDFVCQYLYLIQGGAYITECTLRNYLYTFFANVRIRGLEIANSAAYPAIRFSCGTLRIEPTLDNTRSLYIRRNTNPNAVNHSALYMESATLVTHPTMSGDLNTGYDRFIDARSSVVTATDEWIDTWDALGNSRGCQFASLTIRVNANTVLNGNS